MPSPRPGVTAQFKKFSTALRMLQHVSHLRESLLSALSNLAAIERFLYESIDMRPEDMPSPPSSKSTPPPSPADAPTRLSTAWDAAAFEKHVLSTYKDAASEADRANVRALVEKGVAANLVSDKQARELLAKLK
jgi:hypothetical protein